MKKLLVLLLISILMMSVFMTGCSTDTPAEEAPAEEESTEELTEEESTEEESTGDDMVEINLISGAVGQELELNKEIAEMYMDENPNVTVNIFDSPDAATDRLGLYLQFLESKSSEVDIYQIDVIWPGDLAAHLVDLNDYGAAEVADEHFAPIVENNTVDGELVAIPWFTDAGLLYYRSDLLEKYDLDVPSTWDELESSAKIIQEGERADNPDFWGYVWQGNAYEGLTCDAIEWLDSNGGGTVINKDKEITVFNEKAIEIVDQAASWVGTISPEGVTSFQEEEARNMFQGGNAAFMRNWPYAYSLGNADDSVIKDKFDVSPLPSGDSGSGAAALGGWQLAVSKYSENPEVAADVALYFANEKSQKMRAIVGSYNPTIKSLYEDEDVLEASPFFGSLYDVFVNATPRPSTQTAPNYNAVSTAFFTSVHTVLTGEMDAEDAFEELQYDLQDITDFEIK
jgi:trehalose/maltose transport system substrate-binding protein